MIFLIISIWLIVGIAIQITWSNEKHADGFEICNPYWAYKYHKSVNWFGAFIVSLLYTALCPITAIFYWFYKLCTVGRR